MTKASNFGKYFRYKLAKHKPHIIIFTVINFFSTIMPMIILKNYYQQMIDQINNSPDFIIYGDYASIVFLIMGISTFINVIMITITTVSSLKLYHDRADMDTLGCLPLSYGERFWGDLLSGICANYVSLVPLSIISLIMVNFIKPVVQTILDSPFSYLADVDLLHIISVFVIEIMISYIGVYAVTTFVSSCCGKSGTSVIYSLIVMTVLPGIYTVYSDPLFTSNTGIDVYKEISANVGALQPFGAMFSIVMRLFDPFISVDAKFNFDYLISLSTLIVSALVIAAFIAGAYIIGKNRKAEKTGEGFVFNAAFYTLSLTFLVMVFGALYRLFSSMDRTGNIFIVLPIMFVFYSALEFSQKKSFKGAWKTVARFALVMGACFLFITLVNTTNIFDYHKKLPRENSIKEIRVSGNYFFTGVLAEDYEEQVYRSANSISIILSEHEKLLEADGLETGYKVNITYVTKTGREINRGYTIEDEEKEDPLKEFSSVVYMLEEFDPSVLGIIGGSDFSGITAVYDDLEDKDKPNITIRSDKMDELAEILRSDIEKYYYNNSTGSNVVGYLELKDNNGRTVDFYRLQYNFEATLEFLNDPENCVQTDDEDQSSGNEDTERRFDIGFYTNGKEGMLGEVSITVSENDASEYAKELLSYIEQEQPDIEYSGIRVHEMNSNNWDYRIREENKTAAVKAILNLFRERYSQ